MEDLLLPYFVPPQANVELSRIIRRPWRKRWPAGRRVSETNGNQNGRNKREVQPPSKCP